MDHQGCDINIIAVESGEVVRAIRRMGSSKWCKPCFSTNSDLVACQVEDKDNVQIWDVNTGRVMQVLQGPGYGRWVTVAFSYDSKYLVAGYQSLGHNSHVRVWCVKSGENLYKLDCDSIVGFRAMALSLDSKFVALSNLHEVQIWEPRTGHRIHKFQEWEEGWEAQDIAFSADSDSTFLAVTSEYSRDNRKVGIWQIATGTLLNCIQIHYPNSVLSFDPLTGDVLTDRCIFKNSSWERWDELPRQGYPVWHTTSRGDWICRNGESTIYIPGELGVGYGRPKLSDSLLAYTNYTGQVKIIKFPTVIA
ncbi:quinon protein alcohol dehydrogenase-like superfamily [Trichoderma asperelloides]|nr:quinon protein alcohol dehydrogenase-like superfamily [Trichoderma asperelloides]